jgi:2-dehydro-3-deoxyphosphooctonate aldolase (KDO 8-P synthase)
LVPPNENFFKKCQHALGISSFFLEVHPDPDNAPSDGPNMLRLDDFEKVVADMVAINKVVG